ERATPALVQAYRKKYGLDKPIVEQYFTYLKTTAIDRDLGVSVASHRKVWTEIRQKFPATIELAAAAMIFAVAFGLPLGFFAAKGYGRTFDQLTLVGSLLGISIPIFFLTIIGLQTGLLLSGAVLTETVFAWPGMGSWLRDAIFNRDYPVLQGGILFLALVFVFVNLIVDISYAIINPRIRYS